MSQTVETESDDLPERVVRNCSQYASTLHRDADSGSVEPACTERIARSGSNFVLVSVECFNFGRFRLCQNPACFGRDPHAGRGSE